MKEAAGALTGDETIEARVAHWVGSAEEKTYRVMADPQGDGGSKLFDRRVSATNGT